MIRERTHAWHDPRELAAAGASLSGLEFLSRIGRGELPAPPAVEALGITPIDVGDAWIEFRLVPAEWHDNGLGTVHGGILSTLADSAMGCAVHSKLRAGAGYTSLDLTITFTRAATVDTGPLTCRGEVVSIGRRIATAEARIIDARGRLIARAVSTCLLIPEPS